MTHTPDATAEAVKQLSHGCCFCTKANTVATTTLTELQAENRETRESFETVQKWGHSLHDVLVTLLERFDDYSDGAPDATALGKFCNEMVGLYNSIQLKEMRTLKAEVMELRKWKHRMEWLHANAGAKDSEGYEWGVARVKWNEQGQPESVLWTLSDCSDLDAEIEKGSGK